jgi:hypothetical protein
MKLSNTIIAVFMIMCMVNSVCAAPNTGSINTKTTQSFIPAPESIHANLATGTGASTIVTANSGTQYAVKSAVSNVAVSNAVSFTSTPTSGTCIDNTKKIAIYLPSTTTSIVQQSTMEIMNIPITYDPFCTSVFFEYNPDYLNDSDIADKLTTSNYDLLIVPKSEMSNVSAIAINTYLSKGGSVWFLNDPSLLPNESPNDSVPKSSDESKCGTIT